MPGVPVRLHAGRRDALPLFGDSLGVQLGRRRRDFGQTRVEAAALLGVYWKTLRWWEEGLREPTVSMYPALIRYLGREPWAVPTTVGEELLAERRRRGLCIREASIAIGVDENTLARCEASAVWPRYGSVRRKIERFLRSSHHLEADKMQVS